MEHRIITTGDALISALLNATQGDADTFRVENPELMEALHRAKKNVRSRDYVANFSLQLAQPKDEQEITTEYGYIFIATGLSVVYDGTADESPLVQVQFGQNEEHPPIFSFDKDAVQYAPARLIAGPANSDTLTEDRDYFRAIGEARQINFSARRSSLDASAVREVSVILHGWEVARNWS